ncbi:MAG: DUF5687 family protein [Bacteroidales bacterium]|nr:DUF5687 family protein [Bacteroidales bacterium]
MNLLTLYRIISKNKSKEERRNPSFDSNRVVKFLGYFMVFYFAALMIFLGVMFPVMFREIAPGMEPYHIMNQGFVYLLIADFLTRFLYPSLSKDTKPYLLLPVRRSQLVSAFLLRTGLQPMNLMWMCVFVPFAALTLFKFFGIGGILTYLIGIWLLIVMNSLWYQLCRMLIAESPWAYFMPVAWFALLLVAEFTLPGLPVSRFTMELGEGFIMGEVWAFAVVLAGIALLYMLSLAFHKKYLYLELARHNDTKVKHVREYRFLEKFGEVGEYLKLELKLDTRNKVPRNQLIMGLVFMIGFTAAIAYTDVYDGFMTHYICVYNFAFFGVMNLGQIMTFEGNYIDGLMTRKESVYSLICAKYYLNLIVLIIPFLMFLVPVYNGKMTLLMIVSLMIFTAGFVLWMILQLTAYNKTTVPLNVTITKNRKTNSLPQMIVLMGAFGLPLLIESGLKVIFGTNGAFIAMLLIGLAFLVAHRWWLKRIYRRFMKRRYENMEGFRACR